MNRILLVFTVVMGLGTVPTMAQAPPPPSWPMTWDAATDFNHPTGSNGEGDYTQHDAGYLIEGLNLTLPAAGPPAQDAREGDFRVNFLIRRGAYGCAQWVGDFCVLERRDDKDLFALQIWDATAGALADKGVPGMTPAQVQVPFGFFPGDNEYTPCSIDFTTRGVPGHTYDLRVLWYGWFNGQVTLVELKPARGILALPAEPTFADLFEKADVWNRNIQANHLINNQIVTRTVSTGAEEEIGDSAIWTGLYVASEALRYGATGRDDALANMEAGLRALHEFQAATGQPGVLTRYVYEDGSPHAKPPSKDTYTGVMFGYGVAYPHIQDANLRSTVEQDVRSIAQYSVENEFGNIDPNFWLVAGLNGDVLLGLHIVRVALSVLPDASQFHSAYADLISTMSGLDLAADEHYLTTIAGDREADAARCSGTHHLKWLALYNLAQLEELDPFPTVPITLHEAYGILIGQQWPYIRDEYNTLYNFVHALYGPSWSEGDIRDGTWSLQLFPFDESDPYLGRRGTGIDYGDSSYRDMVNAELGGIFESDLGYGSVTRYPIPLDKRHRDAFIWQRGSRRLTGDNQDHLYPGIDYLLVYWMGRYHGLFDGYADVFGGMVDPIYVDWSYVGPRHGTEDRPFRRISRACDFAVAGSTVIVKPGNYSEEVEIAADTQVVATQGTVGLAVNAAGVTNRGTIRADNGSAVQFGPGLIANTGGIIAALDGGTINLGGVHITGGLLRSEGTGGFTVSGSGTRLEDVSIATQIDVLNGATSTLAGSIANAGVVSLNSAGFLTHLKIEDGTTLTGGGTVALANHDNNRIVGLVSTARLINADNTIEGGGSVGYSQMALTNQGLIHANVTAPLRMELNTAGMINMGTMQASAGGTLEFSSGPCDNTIGTIQALGGGTVRVRGAALTLGSNPLEVLDGGDVQQSGGSILGGTVQVHGGGAGLLYGGAVSDTTVAALDGGTINLGGVHITGGLLRSEGTGGFTVSGSGTRLEDVSIATQIDVLNGATSTLAGSIANAGVVSLNSAGFLTHLKIEDGTTLTGGGTVALANHDNNRIVGLVSTARLINADNTIEGGGSVGYSQMALTNQGLIHANVTAPLRMELNTAGMINMGTMQASAGGTLEFSSGPCDNTIGTIQALGGGTVRVRGAALTLGSNPLEVLDGGDVQQSGGSILGGTVQVHGGGAGLLYGGAVSDTTVAALDGGTINLGGVHITGGLLRSEGTGGFTVSGSGTRLEDVSIATQIDVLNGATSTLAGSIANAGVVSLNSAGFLTHLKIEDGTTLTGGGTVALANHDNNRIVGLVSTARLINADNTIEGGGSVGYSQMALTNQGLIHANVTAPLRMELNTAGMINMGTMQASAGGTLEFSSGPCDNTIGTIQALGGGTVRVRGAALTLGSNPLEVLDGGDVQQSGGSILGGTVQVHGGGAGLLYGGAVSDTTVAALDGGTINLGGVHITGGLLRSEGTGGFTVSGSGTRLEDVSIATQIDVLNGATSTLAGSIANAGVVSLNSAGFLTHLKIEDGTTLTGGGTVALANHDNNRIVGLVSTARLINADNTIEGGGSVGYSQMALTNQGLIHANVTAPLRMELNTAGMINMGTMQASAGGTLEFSSGPCDNDGLIRAATAGVVQVDSDASGAGVWSADGGKIELSPGIEVITTGVVEAINAGELELNQADLSAGYLEVDESGVLDISGTISLEGALQLASTNEGTWQWATSSILQMTGGVGAGPADWASWASLEIAGTDSGLAPSSHVGSPAGFVDNFSLPELVIGPGAQVFLADAIDNGNRNGSDGLAEALYVETLTFADASGILNLNGLHVYFNTLNGDPGQIIDTVVIPCVPASDFDCDGDVDLDDYSVLAGAMNGPNEAPGDPAADLDADNDCDLADFVIFQSAFGG